MLRRNFNTSDSIIEVGVVKADTAAKKVFVAGEEINLNKKEYSIIEYLLFRKGKAIPAAELIEHIWESDSEDSFNSFKVRLSELRKKLPEGFIKNARGHGYYVE